MDASKKAFLNLHQDKHYFLFLLIPGLVFLYFDYVAWLFEISLSEPLYSYVFLVPFISFFLFKSIQPPKTIKTKTQKDIFIFGILFLSGVSFHFTATFLQFRLLETIALIFFALSLFAYLFGLKDQKLLFPCFFLIFFYPWEAKFLFLIDPINRLNAFCVKVFFEMFGSTVVLSQKGMWVTVSDFTLLLVDRCAGLHVIILFLMFLSILPWVYGLNGKKTFLWIIVIPPVVLMVNIIRIILFTFAGAKGMPVGLSHFLLSIFFLGALFACFRFIFEMLMKKKQVSKLP